MRGHLEGGLSRFEEGSEDFEDPKPLLVPDYLEDSIDHSISFNASKSDDDSTGDTIVVDHTLLPEIPDPGPLDPPPGEIGPPPPPRRGRLYGRSASASRSSRATAQPAASTRNAVLTSRITRSQAKSALISILMRDPDVTIAFKETQDYLDSKK